MNKQLQDFARKTILEGLAKCTDGQRHMFKRMYSHDDLNRDTEIIVGGMDDSRLNIAMQQIQRSLDKNAEQEKLPGCLNPD